MSRELRSVGNLRNVPDIHDYDDPVALADDIKEALGPNDDLLQRQAGELMHQRAAEGKLPEPT